MKRSAGWEVLCTIDGADHREAFGKAMLLLSPDLYDKPIKLEAVTVREGITDTPDWKA